MSLNEVYSMAESLLIITAFNAVVAFGLTFTYLIIRDKMTQCKEAREKKNETFNRELP